MNLNEFNELYLNNLLDKLSKENKTVFLLGDFNINFLNYDQDPSTNEFLDCLCCHLFLPHILQAKRVRSNSKTLIDNIFSNAMSPNCISGNITSSISDHLTQFLIVSNIFLNPPSSKSNIYERDWSKFDRENFILDYFLIDWDQTLGIDKSDIDKSFKYFLDRFNSLLDLHAPYKKISKYKLKFRDKP